MLKVVCVVDKEKTALDRLAQGVAKYHKNLDYVVLAVHPKRPDPEQLQAFEREAKDADIIDWQYFRTAEKLRSIYPWLANKKQILTHNNPYSIEESDWNGYDYSVGNNNYITERLGKLTEKPVTYIPITVDTDFWKFNSDWHPTNPTKNNDNGTVIMVANRIESKKGILPVAIACADLGVKFVLVGAISDMDYYHSIEATGSVEFYEQITDEELRELYYRSTIHVCNSKDNFESGTMPVLEAMLCGVPVLTRSVGHVPDLYNGENMELLEGDPDDVLGIKDKIFHLMSDKKKLQELHDKGWNSAKSRSFERRAYMYQKLYREVMWPEELSVSVVVPIFDKPEIIRQCLNAVAEQTHKNLELIVCDDNGSIAKNYELISDYAGYVNIPVRYINTSLGDYGLARARNEGTIEATGEVMVYCDQRMVMDRNAIEEFLKYLAPKVWLYGNKGAKKEFVENFSCIRRTDIIDMGLFNERINQYGGQSQELRTRLRHQGGRTEYTESAKATPTGKSSNRNRKKQEIIAMKNRLYKMELET
jgi:glycosyltransferase involved in cell wall biosynthesis